MKDTAENLKVENAAGSYLRGGVRRTQQKIIQMGNTRGSYTWRTQHNIIKMWETAGICIQVEDTAENLKSGGHSRELYT